MHAKASKWLLKLVKRSSLTKLFSLPGARWRHILRAPLPALLGLFLICSFYGRGEKVNNANCATFRKIRFTIHIRDESMDLSEAKCEV